jgi:hypothetical protein
MASGFKDRMEKPGDDDFSNYGTGGYYGNTYNQEVYARLRNQIKQKDIKRGTPDNYRYPGDRRWDDGRGGWWDSDEPQRPFGYRSEAKRFAGGHSGKGPKNYQRPDELILEDINDRLYDDPFLDASGIEVSVNHGDVILTGTVASRSAKRRVGDTSEAVPGVKNIENRLRIEQPC